MPETTPVMPTPTGIIPAPKSKDHKMIKMLIMLLFALGLIGGALVIGYMIGRNSVPVTENSNTPAAITPPTPTPAPAPAPSTMKTYTAADLKNFTFNYDSAVWTMNEDKTSGSPVVTLTNVMDPTKRMVVNVAKVSLGQYTGNLNYYCGVDSKLVTEGKATGNYSFSTTPMYTKGKVRVRLDAGDSVGGYVYGSNYFTVKNYSWLYTYNQSLLIPDGVCTDNYGTVGISNPVSGSTTPQGSLTRAYVTLPAGGAAWTSDQLAAADAVVATMSMTE